MRFLELRSSPGKAIDLPDRAALWQHCQKILEPLQMGYDSSDMKVELYRGKPGGVDWVKIYVVTINGYGAIGYTDAPF